MTNLNRIPLLSRLRINTQVRLLTAAALAAFVCLCTVIYHNTNLLLLRNAENYTDLISRRLETEFSLMADSSRNVLLTLQADPNVAKLLDAPYSEQYALFQEVSESLMTHSISNPQIYSISLVSDTVHYSNLYTAETLDSFREALTSSQPAFLGVKSSDFRRLTNFPEKDFLIFGAPILLNGREVGATILSMRSVSILSYDEEENEMGSYYVLCRDDEVLYAFNCLPDLADTLRQAAFSAQGSTASVGGYTLNVTPLDKMDCSLISALDQRMAGRNLEGITIPIWACVLLLCAYSLFLFLLLSRNLVSPLNKLFSVIQGVRSTQSRGIAAPVELSGCREIAAMGQEFTNMMNNIQRLNRKIFQTTFELYEAKIQKQQAEISYLRSQVDPHFLYNTLEVVRRMAMERNAPEISELSLDISRIFRYSAKGDSLVPLREELRMMESYLHIQKCRFEDKLEVICHFPEETLSLQVIKMLLQPLVENAIFHGLETKSGLGTLFLGARREGDRLLLSVRDDGVGIPPERLAEIHRELESPLYDTSSHVGLINTHARIQLQYGKEYGLTIDSEPGEGTNITLTLPAQE